MSDQNDTAAQESQEAGASALPTTGEIEQAIADETSAAWDEVRAAHGGEAPTPDKPKDADTEDEPDAGAAEAAAGKGDETGTAAATTGDPNDKGGESGEAATEGVNWEEAPEELRAAFDAERQKAAAAEQARRSAEGRYNSLKGRFDSLTAGEREAPAAGRDSPTKGDPQTDEETQAILQEWKSFKEDFADVAGPVEKMLGLFQHRIEALSQENQRFRAQFQQMGQERLESTSDTVEATVKEAHPDFEDIMGGDQYRDFIHWVDNEASRPIRMIVDENADHLQSADDVNFVLERYKRARGIETNGGERRNGAGIRENPGNGQTADPLRSLQLRSNRGGPRPSPGARVPEQGRRSTETEADVWAELREKARAKQADARA